MLTRPTRPHAARIAALVAAGTLLALSVLSGLAGTSAAAQLGLRTATGASLASLPVNLALTLAMAAGVAVIAAATGRGPLWALTLSNRAVWVALKVFALVAVTTGAFVGLSGVLPGPAAAGVAAFVGGSIHVWPFLDLARLIPSAAPASGVPVVAPHEVWWAQVRFEDSAETKDRPCLILATRRGRAKVLMFTSQDQSGRSNYVPVPPGMWRHPKQSFLRTDRVIDLKLTDLRRRECVADDALVATVRGRL